MQSLRPVSLRVLGDFNGPIVGFVRPSNGTDALRTTRDSDRVDVKDDEGDASGFALGDLSKSDGSDGNETAAETSCWSAT